MRYIVLQVSHRGSGPRGSSNQAKSPRHSSANLCRRHDKSVQVRPHHMSSHYKLSWSSPRMLTVMLDSEATQDVNSSCLFRLSTPPPTPTPTKLKRLWSKTWSNPPRFTDTEESVGVVVRRGVCILRTTLEKPDITVQAWFCVLTTKKDYDDDKEDGNMGGG